MPKGFEGIREYRKEVDAKRDAMGTTFARNLWLKINDGESAVVRFGEQGTDINYVLVHRIPGAGKYPDNIPCLDQHNKGVPCPACDSPDPEIRKTTFRGYITLIWRDGPVFETDDDGKPVIDKAGNKKQIGNKDQAAIWSQGIRVFTNLDELDTDFKGLMSRDFKIKRTGSKVDNTSYTILPADPDGGPQPLSAKDVKLFDEKPDLGFYVTPPTFEEMAEKLGIKKQDIVAGADGSFFKSDPFADARRKREEASV